MSEIDVGYLKRAVEELTDYVKAHMDREEKEREFLLEELATINNKISSIELRLTSLKLVMQILKLSAGIFLGLAVYNLDIAGLLKML